VEVLSACVCLAHCWMLRAALIVGFASAVSARPIAALQPHDVDLVAGGYTGSGESVRERASGEAAELVSDEVMQLETQCQYAEGDSLEYLDRHDVTCPDGSFMNSYGLVYTGCENSTYKYKYSCKKDAASLTEIPAYQATQCHGALGEGAEGLALHHVYCDGQDHALRAFRFVTCGYDKFMYKFTCVKATPTESRLKLKKYKTECDNTNKHQIQYLERHHTVCDQGMLKGFRLMKGDCNGKDEMQIQYTCTY